jgi:two-component sensor histidine kinase
MRTERDFRNQPGSVSDARRFVLDALSGIDADTLDDAAVMTSELASNCLRHAATSFSVRVDRSPEQITISVDDSGPGRPTVKSPPPQQPTGRGLRIVSALASSWGVDHHADRIGKRVWFTLSVMPADQQRRAAQR